LDGEHPLADRQRWQDVVIEMSGDLHHAAGVARRADAATFAGEGHEALGGAVVAPDAGEAVGEDSAAEVGPEVLLDPARHALAPWVCLGGPGQERLEVVLDDGVEGRGRGPAAAVDGGEVAGEPAARAPRRPFAVADPGRAGACGGGHAPDGSELLGAKPWRDGTGTVVG
jgi:hypothetical protein